MRHLTSTVALFLVMCGAAQAATWEQIADGINNVTSIDTSRPPKITGDIKGAWFKTVWKEHTHYIDLAGKYEAFDIFYISINCRDQTQNMGEMTWYFEDGSFHTSDSPGPWNPVTPDSMGEVAMTLLCK